MMAANAAGWPVSGFSQATLLWLQGSPCPQSRHGDLSPRQPPLKPDIRTEGSRVSVLGPCVHQKAQKCWTVHEPGAALRKGGGYRKIPSQGHVSRGQC